MPKRKYPAPGWRDFIDGWIGYLRAGSYAESTLSTRRCQLTALSLSLMGSPLDVEGDDLVDWFASREWRPETRKGARNACVSFFGWLHRTGRMDDDPSAALPSVKRPQAHPRPCPDSVIGDALARADGSERLMLRLGAECGLRRFEIAKVHSRDLMRGDDGWSLVVVGKGDVQRVVPVSDGLAAELRGAGSGYLFPGRWGGHVEASYVGKRLSRLLGDGWTAHSLRHRFATRAYGATHDVLLVSKLLGHASVVTTQRYVAMPDGRLRIAVDAVNLVA